MTDALVVDALVNLFTGQKKHRKPIAMWLERAASAPAGAKQLLEAVATHKVPSWEIGRRFLVGGIDRTLGEACQRRGIEPAFDAASTCWIGGSYNEPHIAWGFGWFDSALVFVEIEGTTVRMDTPVGWFATLRLDELAVCSRRDRPPSEALAAFCEACGDPLPPEILAKLAPKKKIRAKATK